MSEVSEDVVLDEIRRAAFELRLTDPQEAVRVLRRAAGKKLRARRFGLSFDSGGPMNYLVAAVQA